MLLQWTWPNCVCHLRSLAGKGSRSANYRPLDKQPASNHLVPLCPRERPLTPASPSLDVLTIISPYLHHCLNQPNCSNVFINRRLLVRCGQMSIWKSLSSLGRSILAKNKEDTVLVAASSPTIVQKESTESGASVALTSNGATGTSGTSSSPAIEPSTAGDPASQSLVQDGQVVAASTSAHLVEEIGVKVSGGPAAVLALAASAVASDSSGASGEPQLATVVIQFTGEQAPSQHAPLNNSSTMRANVVPNAAGTPTAAAASKRQVSHASGELSNKLSLGRDVTRNKLFLSNPSNLIPISFSGSTQR